jgi:hypothetical protein
MLAYFARSVRPLWYWAGAGVFACVLGVTYVTLQIRVFFHGTSIGWDEGAGIAELGIHASVLFALNSLWLPHCCGRVHRPSYWSAAPAYVHR